MNNLSSCKSTSDESYTLELEEQSLIASATTKIEKMAAAAAAAARNNNDVTHHSTTTTSSNVVVDQRAASSTSSIYRLNAGQFGINPFALGLLTSVGSGSSATASSSSSSSSSKVRRYAHFVGGSGRFSIKSCGAGSGGECARRNVKRLSSHGRFIDHLKKNNHCDCTILHCLNYIYISI